MRIITLLFFISLSLSAQNSYELGEKLYMEKGCHSCHGMKADGMHNYPRLANRAKGFLRYKLERFRSKLSDNQQQEMMIAFAVGLSDEEIDNLTTFFSQYRDIELEERYDDSYQNHGDGGS
ncbi:MAG: c-type cytochrome [Campylobacterota bacterium]|nr:c-type cytochrome [Campylobacterota bacterium]